MLLAPITVQNRVLNWIINCQILQCSCNYRAEFKNEIDLALRVLQKDNIQFYFNDIGDKARKMLESRRL